MGFISSGGVNLYFEDDGAGPPILFLHEFAAELHSWRCQVENLRNNYRCITFNARGYPPSDVPGLPDEYGEEHSVSDALRVLDALGIESAHLVGASMGAAVALHVARQHPGRVKSLVLISIGSGSSEAQRPRYLQRMKALGELLGREGVPALAARISEGEARQQLKRKRPDAWAEATQRLAQLSGAGLINTLNQVQLRRPPLSAFDESLRCMRTPTLLVAGDQDTEVIGATLHLRSTIPGAGLRVYPWSGHTLNIEEHESLNSDLQAFLQQHSQFSEERS